MQLLLPLFPNKIKLITATIGVFTKDGIVNYVLNGLSVFSHSENDNKSFRYITSKLILQGLCKRSGISKCFCVSYDSVKRYAKRLEEHGDQGFFKNDLRHGSCYKLLPDVLHRMQKHINDGKTNSEIARLEEVTEGAIRYAIK
ncbi:hypothetical protein JW935_26515, partial [candidate division KSB1 bacterium]|nr:hypothetical protein [candidate division KSB1 bacterium]